MPVRRISQAELDSDPTEEWRDIPDFPGYRVSSKGQVVSVVRGGGRKGGRTFDNDPKLLRSSANTQGYRFYSLRHVSGEIRLVLGHCLVLEAFVGPCPEGMEACHDPDPDRTNNDVSNLRWDTRRNNIHDALRQGRMAVGSASPFAKLSDEDVRTIRRLRDVGARNCDLAIRFGVARSTITEICKRRIWRHLDPPAEASA